MERGLKIIFLLLIVILSLSIVSAGFFSDFWNKITGKSVETCTDSDGGLNYSEKGVVYYGQNEFNDYCLGSDLVEWYCKYNEVSALKYKCPESCQNGACMLGECTNYYADKDNDGYGDSKDSKCLTSPTEDYKITIAGDCNDDNATINPGADEACDSVDNNCDGRIDEGCPGVDTESPQIIIIYPQTTTYPSNITTLNYSANDDNLESCWYSLDNGITNSSPDSTCSNYTGLISNEGSNTWAVYANDTFGNWISKSVTFNIGEGEICEDGTLYGKCSSIKPKYCDNGNLINNCSLCGCPLFYECQSDGSCSEIVTVGDSDGDGIENIHDPDANGDGVMDASYASINANKDIDGDGILNINDKDIDGDGILNGFDVAFAVIGAIETIEITEGALPEEIADFPFQGYIVELENEPLAVQISELEEQAEKNEGKVIAQVAGTFGLTTTHSNLETKIKNEKVRLRAKRDNFKQDALKKLDKNRIITGSAVAEENELVVLEEYENVFNGIALNITLEEAEKIEKINGVKKVYPNYKVKILLMDSVPLINADDVWQLDNEGNDCSVSGKACLTGQGVTVGIIDTGVDYTHSDLGGCFGINCKVVGGYDFVNNDNDPMDDHGHGTHVAATAAGNGVLKGVAPNAKIYAYKVLSSGGSGSWNNVIAAIERSIDPNQDGNFEDHLDIISLSLGGPGNPDDPISKAIDNAVEGGVVAVIAAGNSGPKEGTIGSPGTARKAITVGASTKYDGMISFSSTGPVIWEDSEGNMRALVKPDIVAPGVSICAAQWDNAWSNRQCLDTEHTAISGTSMATPHVAGATALLLQKNPTWTPEEIKMALRSTAIDIGLSYYINFQGHGRIDALNATKLSTSPCIAKIETNGEASGSFNLMGSAYCDDFNNYKLYYRKYSSSYYYPFIELYASSNSVTNSILYEDFEVSNFGDGQYLIKLEVTDNLGNVYNDYSLIIVKNFNFIGIGDNLNYIKGIEEVRGEIKVLDYDSYKVEYQTQLDYNYRNDIWTEICYNTAKPTSEILCTINVSSFNNGGYYFRINVNKSGTWISSEPIKVIIFNEMLDGWPIELEGFPKGMYNIGYDGQDYKLIMPHFASCTQSLGSPSGVDLYINPLTTTNTRELLDIELTNSSMSSLFKDGNDNFYLKNEETGVSTSCSGSILNIYDSNTTKKVLTSVSGVNLVSIYKDSDNREYMALDSYWSSYRQGIIDFNGNYLYKWSRDLKGNFFLINYINGENNLFNSYLNYSNHDIFVRGINKYGNDLVGFPIKVQKEQGEYSLITNPIIINSNNSKRLAVVAGNYGFSEDRSKIDEIRLFLDIYSLDGKIVKRAKLLDMPSADLIGARISLPIAGDMNNDGNSEIIAGVFVYYRSLYDANRYDINAYETYLYIIDNDGNLIKKMDPVKGYQINGIILGDFGENNLKAIVGFSDTWPTTSVGNKIMSFDYNGNIAFDVIFDDYKDRITGLVMGDVDSDSNQEVVVGYRDGTYNRQNSGFKIFDLNGTIEKDIEIPTLGQADDYWGAPPILLDFNKDEKLDIIQQSLFLSEEFKRLDTRIYAFTLNSEPKNNSWPMFQHDPQHTGLYVPYGKEIDEGDEELCTSHESYSCYDNDVYWYDSCGDVEEKKQECGGNFYKIATENGKFSCSSIKWDRYCDGDHKKRDYLCYENICSGNSCQVETHIMDTYSKYCRNGCRRGRCRIWLPGRRKIICTELYNLGYLDKEKYEMDLEYAAEHFSQEAVYGYQAWAIPVVKAMRKNPEETRESVVLLVNSFIEEISYRMGKQETGNEIGAMFLDRGIPLFERIGKHINEPDWKALFNEENLISKILGKLQNVKANKYDKLVQDYFSEDKIREMYFDAKEKSNGSDIEFANTLLDNLEKAVEEIESMIEEVN